MSLIFIHKGQFFLKGRIVFINIIKNKTQKVTVFKEYL